MDELLEVARCPQCRGEFASCGENLYCHCGYSLEYKNGFFRRANCKKVSYSNSYDAGYFSSALYDFSDYRLSRLMRLSLPGKGKRILDLGCGPGDVALRCAKEGADVYGVDVSRDALALCAKRCREGNVKIHLFEFDGQRVPIKDAAFDSIVLSDVAEHVDDRTLSMLLNECFRLLMPKGRLVIHTSPTRNIIRVSSLIKKFTFGRADLHSRLVNPNYEFLHIRYHSAGSLSKLLGKNGLYCILWGEFHYLSGTKVPDLACRFGLKNFLADQLWCVAFKDRRMAQEASQYHPYLGAMEWSSALDLGRCDELCIDNGFYGPEYNSYRWTGKTASLFIEIPKGAHRMTTRLQTSNPDVYKEPVNVDFFLEGHRVMKVELKSQEIMEVSTEIKNELKPGATELRIKVDRTFVPIKKGINQDSRELGVAVHSIEIS